MRMFSKLMLTCATMLAFATPATAGMQIVTTVAQSLGSQLVQNPGPPKNDFAANLNALGLTRVYSLGADVAVTQNGFVTFAYHGAESGFNNNFQRNNVVLKSEGNESWSAAPGHGGTFGTFAVSSGSLFSTLLVAFGGDQGAVYSLAGSAGFGVFYDATLSASNVYNTLYFGYDDGGGGLDDNHDDMIVSARFIAVGGLNGVPEPASLAMWGIGALGLVFAGRRRRQLKLAA